MQSSIALNSRSFSKLESNARVIVDDDIKRPRRTPGVLAVVPLATKSAQCAKTGVLRVFVTFADEKSYVSEISSPAHGSSS